MPLDLTLNSDHLVPDRSKGITIVIPQGSSESEAACVGNAKNFALIIGGVSTGATWSIYVSDSFDGEYVDSGVSFPSQAGVE